MRNKLIKSQLNQRVLYFSYGSNLDYNRITKRLGEVTVIETYSL